MLGFLFSMLGFRFVRFPVFFMLSFRIPVVIAGIYARWRQSVLQLSIRLESFFKLTKGISVYSALAGHLGRQFFLPIIRIPANPNLLKLALSALNWLFQP